MQVGTTDYTGRNSNQQIEMSSTVSHRAFRIECSFHYSNNLGKERTQVKKKILYFFLHYFNDYPKLNGLNRSGIIPGFLVPWGFSVKEQQALPQKQYQMYMGKKIFQVKCFLFPICLVKIAQPKLKLKLICFQLIKKTLAL